MERLCSNAPPHTPRLSTQFTDLSTAYTQVANTLFYPISISLQRGHYAHVYTHTLILPQPLDCAHIHTYTI